MIDDPAQSPKPWWRLPLQVTLIGFLAVAGFFLVTEHSAHLFGVLPYLLLLVCPLMHFMHHGHGGHDGRGDAGHGKKAAGDRDA